MDEITKKQQENKKVVYNNQVDFLEETYWCYVFETSMLGK
jgi:hypothetical protein